MAGCVKAIPEEKLDEFAKRLRAVHAKYYVLLRFGIETGLRVSDMLRLRVRHFSACMRVYESKTKKTKECQLSTELLTEIENYIAENRLSKSDSLFFSVNWLKVKSLSRVRVTQVFAATASEMGLKSIGAHSMRKNYAQNVWRVTRSSRAVKEALGHERIETTMHYLMDMILRPERPPGFDFDFDFFFKRTRGGYYDTPLSGHWALGKRKIKSNLCSILWYRQERF
jgi:integrase